MDTSIEWTDKVWNPIRGCQVVSPGCSNCYAMKFAHRFSGEGKPYEGLTKLGGRGPVWTGKVRLVPEELATPLGWKRPRKVFVNSMSDLFHEDVPFEFIAAVFGVMAATPQHTYQVLTKRPERMVAFFEWAGRSQSSPPLMGAWAACAEILNAGSAKVPPALDALSEADEGPAWPLPNVWLGVSVEDQKRADERIPLLLKTPAAVRFLSCEPLLGSVELRPEWMPEIGKAVQCMVCRQRKSPIGRDAPAALYGCDFECPGYRLDPKPGDLWPGEKRSDFGFPREIAERATIDWVIVGGESGNGARPMLLDWARQIVRDCRTARVPVFVKQLGAAASDPKNGIAGARLKVHPDAAELVSRRLKNTKGADMNEWPEELRVREWPEVA